MGLDLYSASTDDITFSDINEFLGMSSPIVMIVERGEHVLGYARTSSNVRAELRSACVTTALLDKIHQCLMRRSPNHNRPPQFGDVP